MLSFSLFSLTRESGPCHPGHPGSVPGLADVLKQFKYSRDILHKRTLESDANDLMKFLLVTKNRGTSGDPSLSGALPFGYALRVSYRSHLDLIWASFFPVSEDEMRMRGWGIRGVEVFEDSRALVRNGSLLGSSSNTGSPKSL